MRMRAARATPTRRVRGSAGARARLPPGQCRGAADDRLPRLEGGGADELAGVAQAGRSALRARARLVEGVARLVLLAGRRRLVPGLRRAVAHLVALTRGGRLLGGR